ncbi:hypothetical protein [Actinomadura rayongensis]|uniref:Uncharacterized protein n=1 Tax=Actinomadura rayongensis TaxID=1429076 RepID=A0A6I4WA07_9ACTN|nr:hypothetical protein [Actinomadura rayongensis]MXQ65610.1 hypothetical protein [Actinomadura rayongensis]
MTQLWIDYLNYEHGGRSDPNYFGDGGRFSFDGLVRIMKPGHWPDVLVVGEGDRWRFNGGEGMWAAARAMRRAGGPAYTPLPGSLPREAGPVAPTIFVNPQAVEVLRWYDDRAPDFMSRNRNTLRAQIPGRPESDEFIVIAHHGDIHSGDQRLEDARGFDRFANPDWPPCAIVGDWETPLSGPRWEPEDLNAPGVYEPHSLGWRTRFQHGPAQAGPHVVDTQALDYLCGYWQDGDPVGGRVGGLGFSDVAEIEGDFTPTQIARPNGRQSLTIDRAVLNPPARDAYVTGSYHVHPIDQDNPGSDHARISFALDL